ncbi:MAG: hypothetical protein ABJG88_05065 [Litorimonas sp.]
MQEIKTIYKRLKTADAASLDMSMGDVHAKGLFSLVFHGKKAGHLTRAYFANRRVKPFDAQFHTHTYDLKITVLKGRVIHHVARTLDAAEAGALKIPAYKYKSQLNGGDGAFRYSHDQFIMMEEYVIPPAATIHMSHRDIHTVSCSKGAIWVVEELGFKTKDTLLLGSPFCVDDLYRKPEQFEVNNNYQHIRRATQKLMNEHALCAA